MPGWLKKVSKFAKETVLENDLMESVQEQWEELTDGDWSDSIVTLKESGRKCRAMAVETSELCNATTSKGQEIVQFGSEIHETLTGFGTELPDASVLDTIQQLINGEQIQRAKALAEDLDTIALNCIDKSIAMMDIMEQTMDGLPPLIQKAIRKAAGSDDDDGDGNLDADALEEQWRTVSNVEEPIQDIHDCIGALQELNLVSALEIGSKAFEQLSTKADVAQKLFGTIHGFATNVAQALLGLEQMDISNARSNSRTLLKSLELTTIMRQVAEATKRLMSIIIVLFQETSDRVSTLWEALAFCKECMLDCMEDIQQTKQLCSDATTTCTTLLEKTRSIQDQLETVGDLNRDSIVAIRELTQDTSSEEDSPANGGGAIAEAIALATNMDDIVLGCTDKVIHMIHRITEAFQNLPPIITEGIDVTTSGQQDDDPQPRDINDPIGELDTSREQMEQSNVLQVATLGYRSFSLVTTTGIPVCDQLLQQVQEFAMDCTTVMEQFMGMWDLPSAMEKIQQLCRLVTVGQYMNIRVSQIQSVLSSIIAVMTTTKDKLSNIDEADLGSVVTEAVMDVVTGNLGNICGDDFAEDIGNAMADKLEDIGDAMKNKLKFW